MPVDAIAGSLRACRSWQSTSGPVIRLSWTSDSVAFSSPPPPRNTNNPCYQSDDAADLIWFTVSFSPRRVKALPDWFCSYMNVCVLNICHPKAKECLECGPPKGRQRSPFPPPGAGCASSQSGCPWRRPQLDRCRRGWPAALTTCAAATCPFERWKRLSAGSAPAGLHSLDALGEQSPHREVRGALMRTSLIHPTMIQFQLIIRPVSHRSAWLQQQISQRPYRRNSRTRSKINTWDEHCLIISYTTHLDRCHRVDPCGVHVELIHSQMDFISFLAVPTNVHVYQGLRVDKQQAVSRRYGTRVAQRNAAKVKLGLPSSCS